MPAHFLSLETQLPEVLEAILEGAWQGKNDPKYFSEMRLKNTHWALIFNKSSTRTRVSFEVGIRQLGGSPLFLAASEIQLGRGEPIVDTARVLGRMVDGAIIRTYAQSDVEEFAEVSGIPTINALTDEEHPCQILADLLTIREVQGDWRNRLVTFLGDGDCNVARSWMWAASKLPFRLRIASPPEFRPPAQWVEKLGADHVEFCDDPAEAVRDADVLYTDVWVSMGKEEEARDRVEALRAYQVNDTLVEDAASGAMVLHCLPAYRGQEITADTLEAHSASIFLQAENRLHAQKALLHHLMNPN